MSKPISKSLHTVTVLVTMAQLYIDMGYSLSGAVARTVAALGYTDSPDTYSLVASAMGKLVKANPILGVGSYGNI